MWVRTPLHNFLRKSYKLRLEIDVTEDHQEKCCLVHGCKYGYGSWVEGSCPVLNKEVEQKKLCDECKIEERRMILGTRRILDIVKEKFGDMAYLELHTDGSGYIMEHKGSPPKDQLVFLLAEFDGLGELATILGE